MNIDKYTDAVKNCRFCFMCRHLSAVGNVTFTEADTPRVRASMIYGVTMHPEKISDKDFIDTLYRSDTYFDALAFFERFGTELRDFRAVLFRKSDTVFGCFFV